MNRLKTLLLSAALLLSWPADARSSYLSTYSGLSHVQTVSDRWSPVNFELVSSSHKWDRIDESSFRCDRTGTYLVYVSALYNTQECPGGECIRVRGTINDEWIWDMMATSIVENNSLSTLLHSHCLHYIKKGDVVSFEHMRTGSEGVVSYVLDSISPSMVVTLIKVD